MARPSFSPEPSTDSIDFRSHLIQCDTIDREENTTQIVSALQELIVTQEFYFYHLQSALRDNLDIILITQTGNRGSDVKCLAPSHRVDKWPNLDLKKGTDSTIVPPLGHPKSGQLFLARMGRKGKLLLFQHSIYMSPPVELGALL